MNPPCWLLDGWCVASPGLNGLFDLKLLSPPFKEATAAAVAVVPAAAACPVWSFAITVVSHGSAVEVAEVAEVTEAEDESDEGDASISREEEVEKEDAPLPCDILKWINELAVVAVNGTAEYSGGKWETFDDSCE